MDLNVGLRRIRQGIRYRAVLISALLSNAIVNGLTPTAALGIRICELKNCITANLIENPWRA